MIRLSPKGKVRLTYTVPLGSMTINRDEFIRDRNNLNENDLYDVTLQKHEKKRSNKLNRYMWGEVVPKIVFGFKILGTKLNPQQVPKVVIDSFKAMNKHMAHNIMKDKFGITIELDEETGEIKPVEPSTKKMTNSEFLDYITEIRLWALHELNVSILLPNEHEQMPMEEWLKISMYE
jgi:hypothetical protein